MNYYLTAFKKYAVFKGRASRMEYWMFSLVHALIIIATVLLVAIFDPDCVGILGKSLVIFFLAYNFATVIPGLAVAARRLHDTNRSGLWLLLEFVPCGFIILLIFFVLASQSGENKYGANPKTIA
ncbi:MAG: DUF805 domain-containing protein [Patescibacteria group bacterium]|jgi:uncharacterized membrane protein YhaH (DUF805 family)